MYTPADLKQLELHLQRFAVRFFLDEGLEAGRSAALELAVEQALRRVVGSLTVAAPATETESRESYSHPDGWWEAVKARFAPAWWTDRWPVKLKTVAVQTTRVTRVCPHLHQPDRRTHYAWLDGQDPPPCPHCVVLAKYLSDEKDSLGLHVDPDLRHAVYHLLHLARQLKDSRSRGH
jgi:hypothetical protein